METGYTTNDVEALILARDLIKKREQKFICIALMKITNNYEKLAAYQEIQKTLTDRDEPYSVMPLLAYVCNKGGKLAELYCEYNSDGPTVENYMRNYRIRWLTRLIKKYEKINKEF